MDFNLREKAKENIIVVAHRGAAGGNIPCNTLAAYETALKQGADMIEVDVSVSADGKLFLFHPMMEHAHLNKPLLLRTLPFSLIKKLRYVNFDNTPTQFGISSFEEFLEQFKGRCYINIDKFWSNPEKIYSEIRRHGMENQILVKSKPSKKVFDFMESFAPELPFMPIVNENCTCHEELMKRNINYIGIETCFKTDSAPVAQDEFIEKIHSDGKLLWVNSIIFNHKNQLAGGHSDDTSLTVSEDEGWGYLADKGYDFIQTDWPGMVVSYLKDSNKYYK
ncbi:MAG: glycerophosphodiester phosphodiesterase family protein [Ruminococcaceae bacterium]|nr:glycerophosphodiester phosphodiesterase family protein [Oscillospiraceae bacterium]